MKDTVNIDTDYQFDEEDIQAFHDWYDDCRSDLDKFVKEMNAGVEAAIKKHGGENPIVKSRLESVAKLHEVIEKLDITYDSVIDVRRRSVDFVFHISQLLLKDGKLPAKFTKEQREVFDKQFKVLRKDYDYNKVFLGKVTSYAFYSKYLKDYEITSTSNKG